MSGGFDAIYKIQTGRKVVALTFDIGWGGKTPGPVLDCLEKKGVNKVTFFLAADWPIKYPEIARRICSMGAEIGSHGHLHHNYTEYANEWIDEQVRTAEKNIFNVTRVKTSLIRTPNGVFNKRVLKKLHSMGYKTIHWSLDSFDWMNPGVDVIVQRVLFRSHPGAIILMHASDTAEQTADALPLIIDGLRARRYQFLTVSELIASHMAGSRTGP